MAYRYSNFFSGTSDSPYDSDEREKRRREDEMLSTLASAPAPMQIDSARKPAAIAQPQPGPSAAVRAPSPEAPPEVFQARPNETTESGFDFGDAITNYGLPALAGLLDLATNKGRGLGTILQSGALQANQRAISRRELAADKLEFLSKEADRKQRNAYYDYLNRSLGQRAENQVGTAQRQERGLKLREDQFKLENDPGGERATAYKDYLYSTGQAPRGSLNDLSYAQLRQQNRQLADQWELSRTPQIAAAEAQKAGARANATNASELRFAAPTAAASAQGRVGVEMAAAPQLASIKAQAERQAAEETGASKVIPGTVVRNEEAYAQNAGDPTTLRRMQDDASGLQTAFDALRTMRALRAKHGTELYGDAKTQYDMAQAAFNTGMTKAGSTGTLTDSERRYYTEMVPTMGVSGLDALRVIPGQGDPKLQALDGAIQQFGSMANSKLYAYGLGLPSGAESEDPPAPARPARPKPRPSAKPAAESGAAAQPTGDVVTVTAPNGESRQMPREQAERVRGKPGWRIDG